MPAPLSLPCSLQAPLPLPCSLPALLSLKAPPLSTHSLLELDLVATYVWSCIFTRLFFHDGFVAETQCDFSDGF